MAILLVEIVIVAAVAMVLNGVTLETGGFIYALIGCLLGLFELGRLVVASAGASISTAVIMSLAFDGSAFQSYTADATPFLILLALLVVVSAVVTIKAADKQGGTR